MFVEMRGRESASVSVAMCFSDDEIIALSTDRVTNITQRSG